MIRVLSTGGVGGKVLPQTPHLPPQKSLSAMRIYNIYTGLNQLSEQTLDDIIDKYKYILLNESLLHPSLATRGAFPPKQKFLD